MITVSIRTIKAREQGKTPSAAPSLFLADDEQNLTLMIKLAEAAGELKMAALRIFELGKKASDKLLHMIRRGTYSWQE
jgi:hypothetical protein